MTSIPGTVTSDWAKTNRDSMIQAKIRVSSSGRPSANSTETSREPSEDLSQPSKTLRRPSKDLPKPSEDLPNLPAPLQNLSRTCRRPSESKVRFGAPPIWQPPKTFMVSVCRKGQYLIRGDLWGGVPLPTHGDLRVCASDF